MDCKDVYKLMNKYIDDEISHEEERVLEFHLIRCKSCQKEFGQLKEMNQTLNTMAPSHDFTSKVMDKIKEEKEPKVKKLVKKGRKRWLGIAVAAVLMVGVIIPLWSNPVQNPQVIVSKGEIERKVNQNGQQEVKISDGDITIKGSLKNIYSDNTTADMDSGLFGYLKYKLKEYYNGVKNWFTKDQEKKVEQE